MKNGARRLAGIVGVLSLCLAAPAFGQQSATVNFTGETNGVYDPYNGTVIVSGNLLANNNLIVCDDDTHSINSGGQTWSATAYLFSDLAGLTQTQLGQDTYFGNKIGLGGYAELAILADALLSLGTNAGATITLAGVTGVNTQDLSDAIWDITSLNGGILDHIGTPSPNALALVLALNPTMNSLYGEGNLIADLTAQQLQNDQTILEAHSNLYLLVPNTPASNTASPQEMITRTSVPVPEGGAIGLYLLLAGVACFGAMRLTSRNQFESSASA